MKESKYQPNHKPHPPGQHKSPYPHQPDKAAMSHNLSDQVGYESNGFKKHRDNTPI